MSAEFSAKFAREITDNKNHDIEKWYSKFKDELFVIIQLACLDGHDSLLLKAKQWNDNELYKHHLTKRLNALGYKTELRTNEEELVIMW
jgi:hypothetical protein